MNLENPNKGIDYIHYVSGEQLCAEREFKAGADAMLEALGDARFPYTGGQFAGLEIAEDGEFRIILKK